MPAFFLALLAAALSSIGARDQLLLAGLSARLGQKGSLLVLAGVVSLASSLIAALLGQGIGAMLSPSAQQMLVAIALLLAAVEMVWPVGAKQPVEPTRSMFAIAIVLAARQVGDGPRFLVFALAAATGAPVLAGAGGALGGFAALALGWALGDELTRHRAVRPVRLVMAGLLLLTAIILGLSARGLLG